MDRGKDTIDKYVRKKGYEPKDVLKNSFVNRAVKELNLNNQDELYSQLSHGGAFQSKVGTLLFKYYNEEKQEQMEREQHEQIASKEPDERRIKEDRKRRENAGIVVEGVDNLMIRIARCCNPVPGDDIIGFITKGRGISVHRTDCPNITSLPESEKARFIQVRWDGDKLDQTYTADVSVIARDRKGLFSAVSRVCEDMDVHIDGVNAKSSKDETINVTLTLSISSRDQIEKVLRALRSVPGAIRNGLVVLLGVAEDDIDADAEYIAGKVAGLRVFEDEDGKMNRSVQDIGGQILAISQFTLLGDVRKGKRPSFTKAAPPEEADRLYQKFMELLKQQGLPVEAGVFQADMLVRIYNDGPVTILLDSKKTF